MPSSLDVTVNNRQQLTQLSAGTIRDMRDLWPALDLTRLDETFPAWLTGVQALIARDRNRANIISAAYLRELRAALNVSPGPTLLAGDAPAAQVDAVMRIATVITVKDATAKGVPLVTTGANALTLATGAAARLVLDSARDTVTATAVADPASAGWRRVGRGACGFCAMLIGRGAVYNEATVRFSSHAHCHCTAEPVYGGRSLPATAYKPTVAKITDADRARVREFLAKNNAG